MKKPSWLKNAVAKPTGFYAKNGEKLKSKKLSDEFIAEWNGTKAAPAPAPKVEVEEVKEEAPKPVAKKKTTKKKTSSTNPFAKAVQKAKDTIGK
jgi:hypothetical protein